jgi:hypothetical protein
MAHVVNADIQMHYHNDSYGETQGVVFLETRRHLVGLPFWLGWRLFFFFFWVGGGLGIGIGMKTVEIYHEPNRIVFYI